MSAYAPPGSMAWSGPQYPASMPAQSTLTPMLKFFIKRDDGSLVPLVPVDELPDDVRLVGVPLNLAASQAKDMLFLGHDSSIRKKFSLAGAVSIKESVAPSLVAMRYTPQSEIAPHIDRVPQHMHTQSLPGPTSAFIPTQIPLSLSKSRPLYNERPLPPSGIEPDQRKKIYCTYWIQNQGQCAYKQQGCIYKHEMPEDKETLESIGLKSAPAWWRKEQARKKSKAKRTDRNGSISEWEVVEHQQTASSAVHSDNIIHVRVRPSRPVSTSTTKQAVQQCRSGSTAQKDTNSSDVASDTATAGSSAQGSSPPGGVRLDAAKTPVRGPPSLPVRKQTLDSPIEDEGEGDLIDFDILVPSSSPGVASDSQTSSEARTDPQSKEIVVSERSKIITKGRTSMSSGGNARSNNKGCSRRGSAEDKNVALHGQRNTAKGKIETGREKADRGNVVSRRGRAKTTAVAEVAAKATGETDTQSDGGA
ncbi:hypothetical protein QM012_005269 [Aureobasidium pullulans]|uniref:C3H1-type domain-containing protein n=1 Tax=Aureobasidium pullulans TaxID=5580 RepID=A0ABR0T5E4_AURPU